MNEALEKRRRLGRLLRATAKSPYLKWIAKDAGIDAPAAKKILETTADTLDPVGDVAGLPPPGKMNRDRHGAGLPLVSSLPPQAPSTSLRAGSSLKPQACKMILNTDGASRGNPGPAGAGAYLTLPDGTVMGAFKKFLGHATNNYAEYCALILGLDEAARVGATELEVRSDSELLVRQLTGRYKVKHPDMKQLVEIVRSKEKKFRRVFYLHIPREENLIADKLGNEAIDEA